MVPEVLVAVIRGWGYLATKVEYGLNDVLVGIKG